MLFGRLDWEKDCSWREGFTTTVFFFFSYQTMSLANPTQIPSFLNSFKNVDWHKKKNENIPESPHFWFIPSFCKIVINHLILFFIISVRLKKIIPVTFFAFKSVHSPHPHPISLQMLTKISNYVSYVLYHVTVDLKFI